MQHNFSTNQNINASQSLPASYEEWLDSLPEITDEDLNDIYEAYREDRRNGNILPVSHIFSTNHQPSRYTEALEQLKEQHEYDIYPKLSYAVKMSMFFLLTKDERHGYSRKAVAISRTNYQDAFNGYLQTITPAVTLISNNGYHSNGLQHVPLSCSVCQPYKPDNSNNNNSNSNEVQIDSEKNLDEPKFEKALKKAERKAKLRKAEQRLEQINNHSNGSNRHKAPVIKYIGFSPDVSHREYERWVNEIAGRKVL